MAKPKKYNSHALIILTLSVMLGACEDFVRFKTEKYVCDTNRLGLQSIELETQRGKTKATLSTNQGKRPLEIVLREKQRLELKVEDDEISINRETGEVKALFGARYATLTCEKSVFAM